jgi:hypothetical protein
MREIKPEEASEKLQVPGTARQGCNAPKKSKAKYPTLRVFFAGSSCDLSLRN